ncbi:MAG: DUF3253 domain-containing protein [Microcoleaceae cyanobacterium]
MINRDKVEQCILEKVRTRGTEKTICPSEVARELGGETWRDLMPIVREIGAELSCQGKIVVLQKGQIVDPNQVKGPIRYRLSKPAQSLT